jgi:alkylation response protein AidB-like acyl-CoA dehydrogenase
MPISFREDTPEDRAFRMEVRTWVTTNLPPELKGWSTRPPFDLAMRWYKMLVKQGWIAPHWPKQYGGMGATLPQQIIIREEFARAGAPETTAQGINHIGPLLIEHGNEAQKKKHLPPILSGDVVWCQGYSEPNSGSDLASLRTRADDGGQHFIVNGQKIWTTWANHADWIFMLVRTDPNNPKKQAGISFLLCDMKTPGIRPRPIRTIAGDEEFCEVFFDNVKVPKENMVGPLNDGWRIANSLLAHERIGSGNPQLCFDALERTIKVARATGALDDPAFRDRLAEAELEVTTLSAMFQHAVGYAQAKGGLGPDSSIMKIIGSECLQRLADLLLDAAGPYGAVQGKVDTPDGPIEVATLYLQCRRATIYGGSSEIQRNVIAKRVLGLP